MSTRRTANRKAKTQAYHRAERIERDNMRVQYSPLGYATGKGDAGAIAVLAKHSQQTAYRIRNRANGGALGYQHRDLDCLGRGNCSDSNPCANRYYVTRSISGRATRMK